MDKVSCKPGFGDGDQFLTLNQNAQAICYWLAERPAGIIQAILAAVMWFVEKLIWVNGAVCKPVFHW